MALLDVLRFPDPRLRYKSKRVDKITSETKQLAKDMLETMYNYGGVGLAAVQVAQPIRLLVADTRSELVENDTGTLDDKNSPRYETDFLKKELVAKVNQPLILCNPKIVKREGQVIFPEGCLSFPSYFAEIKRAEIIELSALNENGEEVFIKTDGLLSICLQHEVEHLDGKLFIDHLSPIKMNRIREEIRKYGYSRNRKALKKQTS